MKLKIVVLFIFALLACKPTSGFDDTETLLENETKEATGKDNVAYQLAYMALEGTANDTDGWMRLQFY